jgi:hypothetical protein
MSDGIVCTVTSALKILATQKGILPDATCVNGKSQAQNLKSTL